MGELATVAGLWAARQELPKGGNGRTVALWRVISGMEAGKEDEVAPAERAAGLKKLVNVFARVLKNEFREHRESRVAAAASNRNKEASPLFLADRNVCPTAKEAAPLLGGESGGESGGAFEPGGEDELPRHAVWDPVAVVCSYLNLAERAISKFGREVTGYSAQQMADRLRVRDVREALRAEAEAFVRKEQVVFHAWEDRTKNPVEAQWFLYKKWLAYKRERVNESNEVRALRFGFKYYARYKMACLMEFGMTPDGLEFAAFEELGLYYAAREALGGRVRSDHAKPYQDLWATLWRERREWLEAMKAAWGVEEFLEAHWRDE